MLTGPTVTPLENGAEQVCFQIQAMPNANTSAPCYGQLASSLHKIAFETSYTCFSNRAFYGVTVNGNSQHFDVSMQPVMQQYRALGFECIPPCLIGCLLACVLLQRLCSALHRSQDMHAYPFCPAVPVLPGQH
jgi:hypothetical protein